MKFSLKSLGLGTTLLLGLSTSCQKEFLERTPTRIIADSQLWNDPTLIQGLLANYYDRLPTHTTIYSGWVDFSAYDEAMWSGYNNYPNDIFNYDAFRFGSWDYGLIRDINVALDGIDKNSTSLPQTDRDQYKAEFRFLRAYMYFELVKRYGGVPLVTSQLVYDFSGNVTPLQVPRSKEAEVYDFVASELDAIKGQLGNEPGGTPSNTRANRYTAMALKCRAMLYAASIAKYNAQSGLNISTPGGEVGIPSGQASSYYQKALDAAKEVLAGPYALYSSNPNKGENFYEAIVRKDVSNKEVIWAKDFLVSKDYRHGFTYDNIPRGIREDNLSSSATTPILNFVEAFEYLDGTSGELKIRNAANTDYVYYDNLDGPFQNKDARLYGTVIYPGAAFKGQTIQIQAGVKVWNAASNSYTNVEGSLGSLYTDGKLLTGSSGPQPNQQDISNSGFYLRKFIDSGAGASTRGIRSDTWWVRFRLAEILLNASEAALELGNTADALTYVNRVRARAGFTTPLTSLTLARLQNERRVELAFEDHRVWDLRRWRIAHQLWDGSPNNPSAVAYVLFPYRIVRPGSPLDGKYVFDKLLPSRYRPPRFFQLFNYYTFFGNDIRNRNPKIVRNPFE
ncbi:MAG TPA: RagB/SusD family nutrient uptake outer membrane protein [Hymenobacter sp.]|uniref:RagB/SusD family nutrient uptake outer membrane protein n=1 Tax=Hymenobacter sp. TaxID=1898978 RepID=UPI002D8068CD|nr:RagB/SusD family nutrient uptake outer membrane protein [Hymenobacter sp.]HET9504391.1 RagB/SusD family nutrient uptake outer membrane protein [Hymenobacter sp.]